MASPFIHLAIAARVAPQLAPVEIDLPLFYFGSVAPDVSHLLRLPRSQTHLWTVGADVSGALKLLAEYPPLAAGLLTPPERAFVAGYLCHLVADEQWTLVIYRRYFGLHTRFAGGQEGAELQWALHTAMEARQHADRPEIARDVALLGLSANTRLREDLLPFVSMAGMERLRDGVVEQQPLTPGADRLRHLSSLQAGMPRAQSSPAANAVTTTITRPTESAEQMGRFLARLPDLMAEAETYVAQEALAEFERRAADESVALLRDYLAGRALRPPRGTEPLLSK